MNETERPSQDRDRRQGICWGLNGEEVPVTWKRRKPTKEEDSDTEEIDEEGQSEGERISE